MLNLYILIFKNFTCYYIGLWWKSIENSIYKAFTEWKINVTIKSEYEKWETSWIKPITHIETQTENILKDEKLNENKLPGEPSDDTKISEMKLDFEKLPKASDKRMSLFKLIKGMLT